VVDDDKGFRDSLSWLIGSCGLDVDCVCYASAQEFLDAYTGGRSGCLILDVRMPHMSGLDLQERLTARGAAIPVIVISGHADVRTAVAAMRSGAIDFLEKPFRDGDLVNCIQRAIQSDQNHRREQALRDEVAARYALLSRREREVMSLVVAGWSNKEIGRRLGVVRKTIEVHRSGAMQKMGAANLPDLVRLSVLLEGVPEPPPVPDSGAEGPAGPSDRPPDGNYGRPMGP
jgi:FixJ family two-component response regulator